MAECTGKTERQIDVDTDRDRYMSPIEAKEYGIIDEIIGGEDAVSKVQGDTRYFPKTRKSISTGGETRRATLGKGVPSSQTSRSSPSRKRTRRKRIDWRKSLQASCPSSIVSLGYRTFSFFFWKIISQLISKLKKKIQ